MKLLLSIWNESIYVYYYVSITLVHATADCIYLSEGLNDCYVTHTTRQQVQITPCKPQREASRAIISSSLPSSPVELATHKSSMSRVASPGSSSATIPLNSEASWDSCQPSCGSASVPESDVIPGAYEFDDLASEPGEIYLEILFILWIHF